MNTPNRFRTAALAVFASLCLAWVAPARAADPAPKKAAPTAGRAVDVVLTAVDPKRRGEVEAALLRAGLTAAHAKEAAAKPPAVVRRAVTVFEAAALEKKLTAAGATIEVRAATAPGEPRRLPAAAVREARYEVVLVAAGNAKIEVIKLVREVLGLGLKDAKDLVENPPQPVGRNLDLAGAQALERRFVAAGAAVEMRQTAGPPPAPPSAPPAPPSAPPADARYDVVLVRTGDRKIEVIRQLRDLLGLGLRQAKDIADNPPQTLRTGVDLESAQTLQRQLTEVGAVVEVRRDGVAVAPETAPPAPPPPPSAPPDDGHFDVWLMSAGPYRINVVKAIRETTGLGLTEAKNLADAAPTLIREAVSRDHAESMASRLRDAGATVEVR